MKAFSRAIAALVPLLASAAPAAAQNIASPDGRIAIALRAAAAGPTYTVAADGRTIIAPSTLGIEFARAGTLMAGLAVTGSDTRSGEDRYTLPAGKVRDVADRFNEVTVHLAEPGTAGRRLDVVLRAYDSGVALRYALPRQPNVSALRISNELTEFLFPADYACTGLNLGSFGTSHEGEFDPVRASAIRPHNLYELPLVCRTAAGGPAIGFAEADVTGWPVMYLTGAATGALGVQTRLSPRIDDPAIAVNTPLDKGIVSPWRVVMIGASPGALIQNTLLTSLNPAPIGDFGWVKPGKTAWDWWSGPVLASVSKAGTNDATIKGFIDFAAQMHLPYMMVDDGWYYRSGDAGFVNPGADPTRPIPAVTIPDLVAYGRARDVGLIVWVHWQLLDRDMERILALYERWGLKGIKVDFMNRDDQEMVDFYHRLAAATARHHLLLDLHGATHPWGMTRTWPNFITQEGVMGAEYNKWSRRVTARHNVTLAYTRLLTGPMDYTPGGYRNRTPATFQITNAGPQTQTTRGQGLAMYVVYESPLGSVADSPDAYRDQPGLDFLSAVPTSWDETRFLAGDIGEYVAVARRKGRIWYVGAMTDAAREVKLPLGFLAAGRYTATRWQDGASPTDLVRDVRTLGARDTLTLKLAAAGGGVAVLAPAQ